MLIEKYIAGNEDIQESQVLNQILEEKEKTISHETILAFAQKFIEKYQYQLEQFPSKQLEKFQALFHRRIAKLLLPSYEIPNTLPKEEVDEYKKHLIKNLGQQPYPKNIFNDEFLSAKPEEEQKEIRKNFPSFLDIDAFPQFNTPLKTQQAFFEYLQRDSALHTPKISEGMPSLDFLSENTEENIVYFQELFSEILSFAKKYKFQYPQHLEYLSFSSKKDIEYFLFLCTENNSLHDKKETLQCFNILKTITILHDIKKYRYENLKKEKTIWEKKMLTSLQIQKDIKTGKFFLTMENGEKILFTLESRAKEKDIMILKMFSRSDLTINTLPDVFGCKIIANSKEDMKKIQEHIKKRANPKWNMEYEEKNGKTENKNSDTAYHAFHANGKMIHQGIPYGFEIQIIPSQNENNKGFTSHAFYKAKQLFEAASRLGYLSQHYIKEVLVSVAYKLYLPYRKTFGNMFSRTDIQNIQKIANTLCTELFEKNILIPLHIPTEINGETEHRLIYKTSSQLYRLPEKVLRKEERDLIYFYESEKLFREETDYQKLHGIHFSDEEIKNILREPQKLSDEEKILEENTKKLESILLQKKFEEALF
jgi:hypothetical protein